jgi:hypothetical protein
VDDDVTRPPPLYVCVTNLLESRHQKKTGIPRVEYEVARYLAARGAIVVAWSNWHKHFRHVDFDGVIESIARAQSLDLDAICDEPCHRHPLAAVRHLLAWASAALARHLPVNGEPGRTLVHAAFRRVITAWPHLSPRQRRAMAERLRLTASPDRLGHFIDVLVETRDGAKRRDVPRGRVEFTRDSTMLLLGIWWGRQPLD